MNNITLTETERRVLASLRRDVHKQETHRHRLVPIVFCIIALPTPYVIFIPLLLNAIDDNMFLFVWTIAFTIMVYTTSLVALILKMTIDNWHGNPEKVLLLKVIDHLSSGSYIVQTSKTQPREGSGVAPDQNSIAE